MPMPPEPLARLLGLGRYLPAAVANEELARRLGASTAELAETGIGQRHHAPAGEGPSDLALRAAGDALAAAQTEVADLGLIVFATATPDVTFPGSACFLQEKLGAPTVGAIDVRAQSAGFLCGLDLAAAFASLPSPRGGGPDARYARVLVAAGEVLSSGLDLTPRGREMSARLADGAGAAVIGRGDRGPKLLAVRWYTDGSLAERFWCEYPASYRYPLRVRAEDLAAGKHYPSADLAALAPIVPPRIAAAAGEVLDLAGWRAADVDLAIVDYVEPSVARAAASSFGVPSDRVLVPTEELGHVMAGGLVLALADAVGKLAAGQRVLLAAAGPGLAWGAAAVEI
jgi:3-oxoacyl-[acyl-carrier-protein] synthase-3